MAHDERRDRRGRLDPRRTRTQYNIRVANFSLHSATEQLPHDPLDQAVEKLWFNGVTVVAAAGNYGNRRHARAACATPRATTRS